MARKKKSKAQQKYKEADDVHRAAASDELKALRSIFHELEVDADEKTYALTVLPIKGDSDSFVSVKLYFRYKTHEQDACSCGQLVTRAHLFRSQLSIPSCACTGLLRCLSRMSASSPARAIQSSLKASLPEIELFGSSKVAHSRASG